MAFTVKYVPISPGMYNQAPQAKFSDLDNFVPLSQDILNASKSLENLMREISYLPFPEDPLPHPINTNAIAAQTDPVNFSEPVADTDFTEYFSFLLHDNQAESSIPLSTTDDSVDFDMDTTPADGVDLAQFLSWGQTPEDPSFGMEDWGMSPSLSAEATSELEVLLSSTEFLDSLKLEAMQKSLEEFEREFYGEATPVPSSSNE